MKFVIDGFRPLYKNFCVFGMSDVFKEAVAGQEASDSANCVLTYGYIDHSKGLMLEVLACAFYANEQKISYKPVSDEKRITVGIDAVKDQIFEFAAYGNSPIADQFKAKLDLVAEYSSVVEYEKIRSMQWLDNYRYNQFIDDVLVEIIKADKTIEKAFVRMEKAGNDCIIGELLKDTKVAGYKKGEQVALYAKDDVSGNRKLIVDITPENAIAKNELADGRLLSGAIDKFMNDKSQDNMIAMLEILIDSDVVIPCIPSLSEEDQKRLAAAKMVYNNDMSMVKKVFKNKDKLELAPSIMTREDKSYFPAFLSADDMKGYDESFARMKVPFSNILESAKNSGDAIEGIVINPFSMALVLPRGIVELASSMKSSLI